MKAMALVVSGVLLLSACSSSGTDDSGPAQTSEDSPTAETADGYADAKQACAYWEVAKQQTITTIGDYLTAAITSAEAAADASSEWNPFVADLNELYPLATDPDSGSPTDMLATSSRLDSTCASSEEWPGEVTSALPEVEAASGDDVAAAGEEDVVEESPEPALNPLEPEVLLAGVPTVNDLSEVGGKKWTVDKEYSIKPTLYVGPVRSGSEARGNGTEEISPAGCDAVALYSGSRIDGLPWLTNSWGEALQQTAEVVADQSPTNRIDFDNRKKSRSLLQWSTSLRLATPAAVSAVLSDADAALDGECREADFQSEAYYDAAYEDCEACQDIERPERTPVVDQVPATLGSIRLTCFNSEYFSFLDVREQVGAVLTQQSFNLDGSIASDSPDYSNIKPLTTLTKAVDLYNRLEDNIATPQGVTRTPLTVEDVVGVCEAAQARAQEAEAEQERADEAAKYGSADVTYEVVTYDGGDVTMKTPTGTSQQSVSTESIFRFNDFDPGDFLYVSVQNDTDRGSVECSIYVDGERVSRNYSSSAYGIATCEANR